MPIPTIRQWFDGMQSATASPDEITFSACLDNARKCFLLLKCAYLPLAFVSGIISALIYTLWLHGRAANFSGVFFVCLCLNALIISIPAFLVPFIVSLRCISPRIRLFMSNTLFTAVCLVVPILTAHKVWRRQYQELNGFLLLHELLPPAPPRVRPSAVSPDEPLSICADEFFFFLYIIDHMHLMTANFHLWTSIQLPRNFFAIGFSLHVAHFWVSSQRIASIYTSACGDNPLHASSASYLFFSNMLPLLHMLHLTSTVTFVPLPLTHAPFIRFDLMPHPGT
jgi:hypothetical protein